VSGEGNNWHITAFARNHRPVQWTVLATTESATVFVNMSQNIIGAALAHYFRCTPARYPLG
jgi:hypothetical protein